MGVHWFNQHRGRWPYTACGIEIKNELGSGYTLWMARVTCPTCQLEVQRQIDSLSPSREVVAALEAIRPEPAQTASGAS